LPANWYAQHLQLCQALGELVAPGRHRALLIGKLLGGGGDAPARGVGDVEHGPDGQQLFGWSGFGQVDGHGVFLGAGR
jgi:hypothetical protein